MKSMLLIIMIGGGFQHVPFDSDSECRNYEKAMYAVVDKLAEKPNFASRCVSLRDGSSGETHSCDGDKLNESGELEIVCNGPV